MASSTLPNEDQVNLSIAIEIANGEPFERCPDPLLTTGLEPREQRAPESVYRPREHRDPQHDGHERNGSPAMSSHVAMMAQTTQAAKRIEK